MKKLLLLFFVLLFSCEDNTSEENVSTEPFMLMWVNGDPIDPFSYYGSITTFKNQLGKMVRLKNYLYFTFKEKSVEYYLNQNTIPIWYDKDGEDNDNLIDAGLYLNYGSEDTLDREQSINLEIIGSQDYTNFGQAEITEIKDNKISGVVNGQFYNPYRDELQIALLIFENIEIGMDPEGTFYTGDES